MCSSFKLEWKTPATFCMIYFKQLFNFFSSSISRTRPDLRRTVIPIPAEKIPARPTPETDSTTTTTSRTRRRSTFTTWRKSRGRMQESSITEVESWLKASSKNISLDASSDVIGRRSRRFSWRSWRRPFRGHTTQMFLRGMFPFHYLSDYSSKIPITIIIMLRESLLDCFTNIHFCPEVHKYT